MSKKSNITLQNSQVYVVIDLETTGLDSANDQIIDIGAVKFNENETLETYSTLIKPDRPISQFITQLTSISNKDVMKAPKFDDIKDELKQFLSNLPIIGHNVKFDVGFMKSHGLSINQPLIDTYQLAPYILPKDTYSLANLTKIFDIKHWNAHRALPDAEATKNLFFKLIEHAMDLDPDLISQFIKFSKNSKSPLAMVFENIYTKQSAKRIHGKLGSLGYNHQNLEKRIKSSRKLKEDFSSTTNKLDIGNVFSQKGYLSKIIDNFEYRSEQEEIAYAVWECLNDSKNLLLEGGTGIGKTLSYLIPSTLFAIENNSKVVISTNTINLQEQILHKEIPLMMKVLENSIEISSESIQIINLKGRSNYLCLDKWESQQSSLELNDNQARVFGKINSWLNTTHTGDKSEINIERRDREIWDSVSSEHCYECQKRSTFCFLRSLREKAEDSQIILTNHSLLLRDMVQGGGLLPEYEYLIIDEAHHLENEATSQFSNTFLSEKIDGLLNSINGDRGLINIIPYIANTSKNLSSVSEKLDQLSTKTRIENNNLFEETANLFTKSNKIDSNDQNKSLLFSEIDDEKWSKIVEHWNYITSLLNDLENLTAEYRKIFNILEKSTINKKKLPVQLSFIDIETILNDIQQIGFHFFLENDKNTIYWINQNLNEIPSFHSSPLSVSEILQNKFNNKNSVILTSATLAIGSDFTVIEKQVGLYNSDKLLVGSPFNYADSALMCLPTNMPSPTEKNYTEKLSETIGGIAKSLNGHTMVLFTSHKSLRDSSKLLSEYLEGSGIQVIAQGIHGDPNRIINSFIENPKAVILGASSFWEGVDFPKELLKAVVMARLPFEPPNDPIFKARSKLFANPFIEYALPGAVLRFRQGFGRLIRRTTDRGVFVVLDSRITKQRYGKNFIKALPEFTHKSISTDQMPTLIADWIKQR